MKKAGLLVPCLLTGGTEVASLETALAITAAGYAVSVVVYFDEVDPQMLASFEDAGITVVRLGIHRARGGARRLATALGSTLVHARFDVVWLQYMTPTLLPLFIARLTCRRVIATIHVAATHYSPAGRRRIRWLSRHACTRTVCVSHTVAEGFFGSRRSSEVVVIPNALDTGEIAAAGRRQWRQENAWSPTTVVIGFAGRLIPAKGADLLIEAVAGLAARHPELALRAVIVGDGQQAPDLHRLVVQRGLQATVHFTGRLTRGEIFAAIKGFDLFAMPSRPGLEGFGLSALEAMAAGLPVVASRVDALKEIVVDGATGLLCAPDDVGDLAAKIEALARDPAFRQRLARAGVERAMAQYDRQAHQAKVRALLVSLAQ